MHHKTSKEIEPLRDLCIDSFKNEIVQMSSEEFDEALSINKDMASKSLVYIPGTPFKQFRAQTTGGTLEE